MITIIIALFIIAGLQRVLPKFSVNRSVTTAMIFIGIGLFGIISATRLPEELYPSITYPQLTVATTYANAAPEEIETLITKIIEEAISTVKNIRQIRSVSKEGLSLVIADFNWGIDMNIAALNMREKIDLVKEMLPRDAEEPIVLKYNPYAMPILIISITGEQSTEELLKITKKVIKDKLEKLEGVASANITGGREREIIVDVDMAELKAANIDLLAVVEALKNSNLNYPAGTTKEKFYEYLLRTMGEFEKVSEISQTPISLYDVEEETKKEKEESRTSYREQEKRIIHKKRVFLLKDIAKVEDTFEEPASYSRYNGKDNISIAVQKQADANIIHTVEKIKLELTRLKDILPKGVNVEIVYDESDYIKSSINGVTESAWQGGLLAFLVLYMFLWNFYGAFIVTISIPVSILATFGLMYFQGFTINMMSLGGLALGVGMLVDNAIVAVENIYRHQHLGVPKKEASIIGTEQVGGPIIASTLTTVAVFLPMVFLGGVIGQIFKDISFTITFSLTASMFAALSLIPLLTSRGKTQYAPQDETTGKKNKWKFDITPPLQYINGKILSLFMNNKTFGLLIVGAVFLGSLGLLGTVNRELMPKVDTGKFTLKVDLPTGTKLEITNNVCKKIEDVLLKQKEIYSVNTIVGSAKRTSAEAAYETLGSHQGQITISLKKDRKITTAEFVQRIRELFQPVIPKYAKIEYIMQEGQFTAGGETTAPVVIKLHGTDINELNELASNIANKISDVKGLYGIETTIASPSPETKVEVDKDKASLYGINVRDIAQTALIAIKGLTATKFKEEGNEYDVTVRLDPKYKKNITGLEGIQIHSPQGFAVTLNELAKLKRGKGPSEIRRFDQQKVIFVSANLFKETLKSVSEKIDNIISGIQKPEGYTIELTGETEETKQSQRNLIFILVLAFTLVYMIMASQFESLWQPFVIMFTVPFSIIGVALALFITRTSINAVSLLGIIILGGVVVNNAIVLIEYLNEMRAEGKPLEESAIESSKIRLRPILMTTLTTVLGLIPMAISRGEGSELRSPLAITVMGGLIFATMLTLWVIPVLYVIVANFLEKLKTKTQTSNFKLQNKS